MCFFFLCLWIIGHLHRCKFSLMATQLLVKVTVSRDLRPFFSSSKIRPWPHMNRQKRFRELFLFQMGPRWSFLIRSHDTVPLTRTKSKDNQHEDSSLHGQPIGPEQNNSATCGVQKGSGRFPAQCGKVYKCVSFIRHSADPQIR